MTRNIIKAFSEELNANFETFDMKALLPKKGNLPIANESKRIDALYQRITSYIDTARQNIHKTVDSEMVKAYWHIGRDIVEEEQRGKARAEYGKAVLASLTSKLKKKYHRGFGIDTLEQARKFYLTYPLIEKKKSDALRRKFEIPNFSPNLSWTHYRELMRIKRLEERKFYEIETIKNSWSARELSRQIGSLLYDRLAKSRDKKGLMQLSCRGQEIISATDAIKDPFVLEFLDIPESYRLIESKLEEALISNLQHFLLELGKGFAFVARQKRLTLDGDHFYADLIFYHTILKCYIIIDIKTHPLTHNDLGQMQLYTNYYDKECLSAGDNPTIGLILCTEKNDAMVKYTLGDRARKIFASKYQFHLPSEKELEEELKREIKHLKRQKD